MLRAMKQCVVIVPVYSRQLSMIQAQQCSAFVAAQNTSDSGSPLWNDDLSRLRRRVFSSGMAFSRSGLLGHRPERINLRTRM